MARNSETAPSEPSPRPGTPPEEGGSRLREHFRESIRDALAGVDVDALQGRASLRVPSEVTVFTREAVADLEVELAALRAEREELRRGQGVVEASVAAVTNGAVAASSVAWSVAKAMEPVGESLAAEGVLGAAPVGNDAPPAAVSPAPETVPEAETAEAETASESVPTPREVPAPEGVPNQRRTSPTAPRSKRPATPAARRPTPLSESELESVVAPLLTELSNLRAEVRLLRGDPDTPLAARPTTNRQLVKLVAGVLLGFALIVIALAVVLKA